jgi:hypothetical protein
LPPALHDAYEWIKGAGEIAELRSLAEWPAALVEYAAANENNAAELARGLDTDSPVFASAIVALATWLADQAEDEDEDEDEDEEEEEYEKESEEDKAYGLARFVEAQAYAAFLAAATGPKAPAAYAAFTAAQIATEAARFARRDAKFRGSL